MSRLAAAKPSPVAKREARHSVLNPQDEICPVCKSSRYLNTSLRLLVNPECYHKMCESCVDRIFSHGPAACPIPRCGRTLRKARFREQTFEDVAVEREVDIRRRVAAVFNRREDEFEGLRDWNDYLNEVEDITFNLVNGIDVEETEVRFERYRAANEADILQNKGLEERERVSFAAMQKAEREQAKMRREAARREEAEERKELEENRRDVLDRLASGQDADRVTKQNAKVTLKKRMDRQAAAERQRQLQLASSASDAVGTGTGAPLIKGLKAKVKPQPEAPIDPFGGLSYAGHKYHSLQDDYVWAGVQETKSDAVIGVGGYDVSSFTGRALCEAFAGLGVFVGEEMTERQKGGEGEDAIATARAEIGVKDMGARTAKLEDPF